jgi:hypothetical protein
MSPSNRAQRVLTILTEGMATMGVKGFVLTPPPPPPPPPATSPLTNKSSIPPTYLSILLKKMLYKIKKTTVAKVSWFKI